MAEPGRIGILELIARGFGTAVRSWPAVGVVLAVSLAWTGAASVTLRATNFPEQALNQLREEAQAERADPEEGRAAEEAARARAERMTALFQDWLTRAWPNLLLLIVLGLFGWVWVTGGQLGYLDARLAGEASLQQFFEAGRGAFAPVLQTVLALSGLGVVVLLAFSLVMVFGQVLGGLGALGALAALFLLTATIAAAVWIAVNLVCWLIAVAVDRRAPLDGLRASLGAVRGRRWKTAGLLAVWALVAMGLGFCLQVFAALLAGVGVMGTAAMAGLQLLLNALFWFAVYASLIVWYRQRIQAPGAAAP